MAGVYKIYHDGSHYVGIKQGGVKITPFPRKEKTKTELHFECAKLYKAALAMNVKSKKGLARFLSDNLSSLYGGADFYLYASEFVERELHKLRARIKRFRRKAFLNPWNYFVTFTYDSALLDEDSFFKRLPVCLSHLHSRRSWNYMGVWERGEQGGRLHFHALSYVPPGEMVGALYPERYYDKKTHQMRTAWRNTFFDLHFGRTDFAELNEQDLRLGPVLHYLLKYLQKSGDRIVYSRGVPTEVTLPLFDDDILLEFVDYVDKVIVSDECLLLFPSVTYVDKLPFNPYFDDYMELPPLKLASPMGEPSVEQLPF